jgi:hypothetical protein
VGELLAGQFEVYDNDECCCDCRRMKIRDVRCTKCGELYVTDQDELDAGWLPPCLDEGCD